MADLVNLIKRAAVDAVEGEKPAGVLFGTVTSISPLQVNVEQRLTLGTEMLVLTSNVADYTVEMTFDHRTEPTIFNTAHDHPCVGATVGEGSFNSVHSHQVLGKKQVTVHNGLKAGEKVILLRMQGGQKFLVLDRIRNEA